MLGLLQEAAASSGPDTNLWLIIFGALTGAMSAVFGAMLFAQRKVDSNRAEELGKCEDRENKRVERAEGQSDRCNDKLAAQTSIINEQTAAIREFGALVKDVAISFKEYQSEGRRYAERMEANAREVAALRSQISGLERTITDLAYSLREHPIHRRDSGAD